MLPFLLLAPGLVAAQKPVSFVLKGQLDPRLNAPAKVYLRYGREIDSAEVRNGRFRLKGTASEPQQAFLSRSRDSKNMTDYKAGFYLENGTLLFTSPDSLKNAKVGGALLTDEWTELWAMMTPVIQEVKAMYAEADAASPEKRKTSEFRQAQAARNAAIRDERNRLNTIFIKAHPNSLVSLDRLRGMSNDKADYAVVETLLPTLSPALRNSPKAEDIRNRMRKAALGLDTQPALKVGMQAPNLLLPTPDGKQMSLADYRGKYVLVDFWASWCGPCRAENPNVIQAYNAYKDKNFDILGVSIDTAKDRAKWLKAIQDDQLSWTQVSDLKGWQSEAATVYFVRAIPQNFLVDPTGKIVAMNLRGEALQQALAQFVK